MPCTDFYQKRELVGVVLTRVLPDARLLVRAPAIAPLLFTPSGGRRDHMRAPHSPPRGRTFMASEASVHLPCFARARARSKPAAGPLNESASLDCGSMSLCVPATFQQETTSPSCSPPLRPTCQVSCMHGPVKPRASNNWRQETKLSESMTALSQSMLLLQRPEWTTDSQCMWT